MVKIPDSSARPNGASQSNGPTSVNSSPSVISSPPLACPFNGQNGHSQKVNGDHVIKSDHNGGRSTNGNMPHNNVVIDKKGYVDEDVDDEPRRAVATVNNKSNGSHDNKVEEANAKDLAAEESAKEEEAKQDQEFIFIHDTGFTVKVYVPGCEPFDIQVSIIAQQHLTTRNLNS